ncbi:MAG: hypothetical protein NC222_06880 [Staphylococcus sp.]|nr:hypothetical protein [Staphylococcus sp.]
MYWTTKHGTKIKISDMETKHIWNCIRMMDRQICAAINFAMSKNDESWAEPPDDWAVLYFALVEEYNKRVKK